MATKLRGIVILMALLACFALLFSCFFMAYEAGHICCQERCAMIADASACCAQGMEFVLKDGMAYPEMEADITVVGTFQVYDENGATYCHLVNAEIV